MDALKAKAKHRVLMTGNTDSEQFDGICGNLDVVQPNAKTVFGWNSLEEFKEMYERPIMESEASEANRDEKKRGKELEAQLRKRRKREY